MKKNYEGDENEFIYNGKKYKAVPAFNRCEGCAFERQKCATISRKGLRPRCIPSRKDECSVIFIEAETPETTDFIFASTNTTFVPMVGDIIEDHDGKKWLVEGRTYRMSNVLIIHAKILDK